MIAIRRPVTTSEAAEALGVSRATVYRWIELGLIQHVHWRDRIRIPHEEIERVCSSGVAPVPKNA